jgi:hypothetical protein
MFVAAVQTPRPSCINRIWSQVVIAQAVPSGPDRKADTPREVRLQIPHGFPAALARRAARAALRAWNLADRVDDVLLVTSELVQNVTQHTTDGGELRLTLLGDGIRVEVIDTNPEVPVLRGHDPRSLGGRGLRIVAAVARSWGFRPLTWAGRDGKVVWVELSL